MPWDPHAQFDVAESAKAGTMLASPFMQAMQRWEEDRKKRLFNEGVFEQLPDRVKTADVLEKWHSKWKPDQQAGWLSGTLANLHEEALTARQQQMHAQENQVLQLEPEQVDAYTRAHKIPVRTSAKSFQAVDDPAYAVNAPDLDEHGNTIFSADGTLYRSNGVYKAVTGPMMKARKAYQNLQQEHADLAEKLKADKGFNIWHPSTWFSGAEPPTEPEPGAPPAAQTAPAAPAAPMAPLTPRDQEALAWAQKNQQDPRAAAILRKLGIQ